MQPSPDKLWAGPYSKPGLVIHICAYVRSITPAPGKDHLTWRCNTLRLSVCDLVQPDLNALPTQASMDLLLPGRRLGPNQCLHAWRSIASWPPAREIRGVTGYVAAYSYRGLELLGSPSRSGLKPWPSPWKQRLRKNINTPNVDSC